MEYYKGLAWDKGGEVITSISMGLKPVWLNIIRQTVTPGFYIGIWSIEHTPGKNKIRFASDTGMVF